MKTKKLPLVTPGQFLEEELLKPMKITPYRLAKELHVPATRIHAILKAKRAITADTALRLERFFGLSEGYFLRLQADYELRKAKREIGETISSEVKPYAA